jgi:group I intron endonuclease
MECIDVYRRRGIRLINITSGGEGTPGWVPSEETRKKIGEANKYTPKVKGEQHGMYGKKHTPESLAKMSEAQSKREWGKKHPFYGKRHSEETKQKISKNRKGKMTGEDNPFYGKTHTPEALEKMRAVHIGSKASEETKAKQKASALAVAPYKQATRPVFCITNQTWYYGLNEASRKLQLHRQAIRMVCNGELKSTGGYKFEWSKK